MVLFILWYEAKMHKMGLGLSFSEKLDWAQGSPEKTKI